MDKGGDVILLYNNKDALPDDERIADQITNSGRDGLPLLSAEHATEKCDYMTVATVPFPNVNHIGQCLAIVNNYDNWHTQKWLRVPEGNGTPIDRSIPLRSVARGRNEKGMNAFKVPREHHIEQHWDMLKRYFTNVDNVLRELKPIAESVAVNNTIIVMTCNHGQSELLINFVCNARAKGFSIDNILLF